MRLRRHDRRFGKLVFLGESDLDKASKLFERHGAKAILIGRLIPGVGTLISIPAGLYRMPIFGWFLFFTVLDSVIWNAALIGLGWYLGSQWTLVREYASIIEYAILAVLVLGIVWFVWRRRKRYS